MAHSYASSEICPVCHEKKQHITYKYCDRCRYRIYQLIKTRNRFGSHYNVDEAIEKLRNELGIVVQIKSKPAQTKQTESRRARCPCPEYGDRINGTCMFPERKDGTCAKLNGFRRIKQTAL